MARCDGAKQMAADDGREASPAGWSTRRIYGAYGPNWVQDEAATAERGSLCLGGCSRSTQGPLASSSLGLCSELWDL